MACEPLNGLRPSAYTTLPERCYARVNPTPVAHPRLIRLNDGLAEELGLDTRSLAPQAWDAIFSGNTLPCGVTPVAAAYAGHQFGHFVPQLGDGRAILLGDASDRGGRPHDVQLKGCGRTPYSRGGDGRAALGPVLREYLVSEAMHALGIPTTRSLAAVTTGEPVLRERPLPGAILTRVAASHVRVGTFQYFAAREDMDAVRLLADYVIERHHREAAGAPLPYLELLRAVTRAQAELIARWMQVGFIHGVMNTDNMAVSGETIDYGPCAFMDAFDPAAVFSSIDAAGRYAYLNQPHAGAWNLARFAETLLPLIDGDANSAVELAGGAIAEFSPLYAGHLLEGMRAKLGLWSREEGDGELVESLLDAMHRNGADFTLTFRRLCDLAAVDPAAAPAAGDGGTSRDGMGVGAARGDAMSGLFSAPADFDDWSSRWRARLAREPMAPLERARRMRGKNPAYIPRNHRIEQVIRAAVEQEDFAPFDELAAVLAEPFRERPGAARYAEPPRSDERVTQTFCGT